MSAPPPVVEPGWEALARNAARSGGERVESDDELQMLSFEIDGAPYAIPVGRVREIVRLRPITPVPRVPADVLGVVSLRGEIIEVVDLRRRLGRPTTTPTRTARIVVTRGDEGEVAGLLVDVVREVLRVDAGALRPSTASDGGAVQALCAVGDRFVSLLDLERVLHLDG